MRKQKINNRQWLFYITAIAAILFLGSANGLNFFGNLLPFPNPVSNALLGYPAIIIAVYLGYDLYL